ncbi:MAG: IS200/IS605 family transposase [Muribaculaceae bacterium]
MALCTLTEGFAPGYCTAAFAGCCGFALQATSASRLVHPLRHIASKFDAWRAKFCAPASRFCHFRNKDLQGSANLSIFTHNFYIMSFTKLNYHIVFSTKMREQTIIEAYERDFYAYALGVVNAQGGHLYRIGGMPDHVHILVALKPEQSVSNFVQQLKQSTSRWLRENPNFRHWKGWENGYCAFTCSPVDISNIVDYIKGQKQHHRRVAFIDEYRSWLIVNGVSPDTPFFP